MWAAAAGSAVPGRVARVTGFRKSEHGDAPTVPHFGHDDRPEAGLVLPLSAPGVIVRERHDDVCVCCVAMNECRLTASACEALTPRLPINKPSSCDQCSCAWEPVQRYDATSSIITASRVMRAAIDRSSLRFIAATKASIGASNSRSMTGSVTLAADTPPNRRKSSASMRQTKRATPIYRAPREAYNAATSFSAGQHSGLCGQRRPSLRLSDALGTSRQHERNT